LGASHCMFILTGVYGGYMSGHFFGTSPAASCFRDICTRPSNCYVHQKKKLHLDKHCQLVGRSMSYPHISPIYSKTAQNKHLRWSGWISALAPKSGRNRLAPSGDSHHGNEEFWFDRFESIWSLHLLLSSQHVSVFGATQYHKTI